MTRGDEPSPTRSSVLVRLSHTHIRFGSFQRLAALGDTAALAPPASTMRSPTTGPTAAADRRPGRRPLDRVVGAVRRLGAEWIAAGFVHGVLNTDNMNVTGESFDYGPWRFLDRFDPDFTAAYFDQTGLYASAASPRRSSGTSPASASA